MDIRNIAIIAHVDHGKTTLVDAMLKQSGTFRENERVIERVMDSGDLERERGITILAKCTSLMRDGVRINIVDTPGHADFGGEVERILNMVDGVVLLVDSSEGPLPQTKFVLSKALGLGLRPIVVINKVDRMDARPEEVLNEVFELFDKLGATEEQLDFPVLYAVGREGWAVKSMGEEQRDLAPLFDLIVAHVPAPKADVEAPFSMLATTLSGDNFLGRILTGKIMSGRAKVNMPVKAISLDGKTIEQTKITKILAFRGLEKAALEEAEAGDIVSIAGFKDATVGETLCDLSVLEAIPAQPIDPPTLTMTFSVNTSPLAGRDGDRAKLTSRVIWDRLAREAESNIALRITKSDTNESFEVSGRGELQLGILIETMRREGFEFSVSRPRVLYKEGDNGERLEPFEDVIIDVDEEFSGAVVDKLLKRKGIMLEMKPSGGHKQRLVFKAPSRGLIGYLSEFRTDTRGTGVLNRIFSGYEPYAGEIAQHRNGVLVAMESGPTTAYSLYALEDRGQLFVGAGVEVYSGMVIGEHAKSNDLEVNPVKGKALTNMRASGHDEATVLSPARYMTLEEMLSYIMDDELLEVTPKNLRMRKKELDSGVRHKSLGRKKD
ncbi:MAG: translational GTPase TypA [Rickettsiales bacterium]|jgi:GTP-binding protein|nr:translational GTPase TypA [Rickettsiales bacterium]